MSAIDNLGPQFSTVVGKSGEKYEVPVDPMDDLYCESCQ